jgi:hypothetical protein
MASTMLTNSTPVAQTGMPRLFVPACGAARSAGPFGLTPSFVATAHDRYAVQQIARGQNTQAGKAWDQASVVSEAGLITAPGMAGYGRSAPIARRC